MYLPRARQRWVVAWCCVAMLAGHAAGASAGNERTPELGQGHFDRLATEQGLAHRRVWAILQDRRGFLWFATPNGLSRYDGYEFVNFEHEPDNPRSLTSNYTTLLLQDAADAIWVGTRADGLNRLDPATGMVQRFHHQPNDSNSLISNRVTGLAEDASGNLWVATADGLSRLSPDRQTWKRYYPSDDAPDGITSILSVAIDTRGQLWASTEISLDRWQPETDTFEQVLVYDADGGGGRFPLARLVASADGSLWAFTEQRLMRWVASRGELEEVPFSVDAPIFALYEDAAGHLWIATVGEGLYRYEPASGRVHHYRPSFTDPHGLSDALILAITEDRSGCIWVGSAENGAFKLDRRREVFTRYAYDPAARYSLSAGTVRTILEDRQGYLWVGTLGGGLDRVDRRAGTVTHFRHDPQEPSSLSADAVWKLYKDRQDTLWVGTDLGLSRFDGQGFQNYFHAPATVSRRGMNRVVALHQDSRGDFWVGTVAGLNRFDPGLGSFSPARFESQVIHDSAAVLVIHEEPDGIFWMGTDGEGLLKFDPRSGDLRAFRAGTDATSGLRDDIVVAIHQEKPGILWLGTVSGGLHRFDTHAEIFEVLGMPEGLPSNTIAGIVGQRNSSLWISTEKGLAEVDPASRRVLRTPGEAADLLSNGFSAASHFMSPSGEVFFGGPNGIIAFYPDHLRRNPHAPAVVITDLRILHETVVPRWRDPDSPLERLVTATSSLTLSHERYAFSLTFAGLEFSSPYRNRYRYKLDGFDRAWIDTSAERREAHYSNLKPGTYTFRVEASNNDGVWTKEGAQLSVRVLPPWWRTRWAYLLYGLLIVLSAAVFVTSQRRKVAQERAINKRLRRLDRMKDDFLANTSHELRTPLQGIIGIAESLQDGAAGALPEAARQNLSLVVASGQRLHRLVDEILDFSKLRDDALTLHLGPIDLPALVESVMELLRPLAQAKGLRLIHRIDEDVVPVLADEQRLQQILFNLVGNAIKFTPAGEVEVVARSQHEGLALTVRDSGIGIPPNRLERIFQPFEQAERSLERSHGGTGLGLSIVKRLVELHGGELQVTSTVGEGSSFSFTIPFYSGHMTPPPRREPALMTTEPELSFDGSGMEMLEEDSTLWPTSLLPEEGEGGATFRILVVDDDPINCQVLLNHLSLHQHYAPVHVHGGEEALTYVSQHSVDLMLLDVMMPGLSGFETCRRLRAQHSLQELPIIFLTALSRDRDEMTGLEVGGNDYLTKPVSKGQLLARVEVHLELLRRHRRIEALLAERMAEIKVLQGMLPICANCKKIRDDEGYWEEVEVYVRDHSEAEFTHSLCPHCMEVFYPDLIERERRRARAVQGVEGREREQ